MRKKVFKIKIIWVVAISILSFVSATLADKIDYSSFKKVSFALLSGFDYPYPGPEEIESGKIKAKIPNNVLALDKKKIAIEGFMLPVAVDEKEEKVTEFFLLNQMDACHYGAPPYLNGWVEVKMKPGSGTDFVHMIPITVYGKLEVGANILDGEVPSVYRMEAEYVEAAKDFDLGIFLNKQWDDPISTPE